ncbi:flagellar hook-associated protein 2 [Collimonas sp. OK607]|uniref:flagellar filament capping protein FliD n=1 Tax=Collimonas sp. OK607 TaxID=1798194 RepID=UPI0008F39CD1|nr:flagellar filament capping protein FliD [Collimonas sp. OK607]SFB22431.1 flagellar hook-associated protein 2 [Collimonas sp. OK607]
MTTVSSLGVGSGLDLNTLLAGLTTSEQVPVTMLTNQQSSYNAKLSAYGTLQSALSGLQAAAAALGSVSLFQSVTASSSATGVLAASATATAKSGTYAVNVTQLTQAQSLVATGVASTTTAIGSGAPTTVTLQFGAISGGTLNAGTGTYSGATFTADATRPATSITIDSSNNTLAGIRDAINGNAAMGVTATIVNDGSSTPDRLVLTSNATGVKSSMSITVSGDAAVSNLLANDPAATQNMQQTVVGQDAKLTVNGIAVSSASNTVAEAVQGTTMTLTAIGSSTLTLANNTADVQTAISNFVKTYNNSVSIENNLSSFNVAANTQSALTGDATLRNIQTRIRSQLNTPQAGGNLTMLSNIGVSFQTDGTLAIDSTKLTAALNSNMSGVQNLFSSATGSTGLGSQMSTLITGFINTGGALQSATAGVNNTLKSLATQIKSAQSVADDTIARYKLQFNQLDVLMSSMKTTSAYLTAQFAPATTS